MTDHAARPGRVRLCRLADIADGGSQRFTAAVDGTPQALMAVRRGGDVFVYVNACPHIGAPLDFLPGQFLNRERSHILCSNHGALFRIEDGFCVHGPCNGKTLQAVRASVEGEEVFVGG